MSKFLKNVITRSLAVLAVASLLITSVYAPIMADEDFPPIGGGAFIDPVLPPDPGPVDPCAEGHQLDGGTIVKYPTCTENGNTMYSCMRCNYSEIDYNNPPATGHQRDGGTQVSAPTCTESGKIMYLCALCAADMGTEDIPPIGHQRDGGTVIQEPTCVDAGKVIYKCTICGAEIGSDAIPPYGHQQDGGTIDLEPTCEDSGKIVYKCTRCGADMGSDTLPPFGHQEDAGTVVKKPTTTEAGKIQFKCTRCGIVLREEEIPAVAKRDLPQAVFATDSLTLNKIPENSTVKINGNIISQDASGSISLTGRFPQAGDYTITVVANADNTRAESDPQSIQTRKPNPPSNIQTVEESCEGAKGAIAGVDTSMEYSLAEPVNWMSCFSSSQPVSSGIYIVRYKATSTSIASDSIEALVKRETHDKPATPSAAFDGASHTLVGLQPGMVYSTNGGDTWTKISVVSIKLSDDAINQAVSYKHILVKNVIHNVESDVQTVAVGRVADPSGITTTAATDGNNGAINGVGTDMQYRKEDAGSWIDIGSSTVSGLSKGRYFVRRRATGSLVESNVVSVTIDDKHNTSKESTPSASFNAYNMHIDNVSGCRISFDGGKNWTDKIKDSTYIPNESWLHTSNGIQIYRVGNGSTTTDSDKQYITLTKQPTPTGITATSATPTIPGSIVGTDSSMQYKLDNQSNWVDITGSTVPLAAGTYHLRRHGYGNALPSDWLTVVIKASANVEPVTPTNVIPVNNGTTKNDNKANDTKKNDKKDTSKEVKKDTKEAPKEETPEEKPADAVPEIIVENNLNTPTDEPSTASGEIGWEAIEATFESASEPVTINLHEATLIPSEVFVKAAETNTPIVLEAQNNVVWSILPSNVSVEEVNSLNSINLGIVENSDSIPAETLATVEDASNGQEINTVFDIKHEGNFGFKADLSMRLKQAVPGQYANLYTYNKYTGKLEFVDSSVINEKRIATFKMSHASSYVVVTSKESMSQDSVKEVAVQQITKTEDTKDTKDTVISTPSTAKKSKSPVVLGLIIIIAALIVALIAVLAYQKRGPLDSVHKRKK